MSKGKSGDLGLAILEVVNGTRPQSVQELLALLKKKGINEKLALESIDKLQAEGSLRLEINQSESQLSRTTSFKFGSALWYVLTIATSLMAAILVFVIPQNFYPLTYIRNIFGIAFVLFLPGFALTKTIFWKSSVRAVNGSVETIERIALSFGLSIGVVTILGLFLYYSALGFHFEVIVITVLIFTAFFATLALFLENKTRKVD